MLILVGRCTSQVDPKHRNLLQLGYDQPLSNHGPRGAYAYYHFNNPDVAGTNTALRLAIAPVYWAFAALNYSWTNVGHKISLAATAGGSEASDRFNAWRWGGVLPLVAEFPLVLTGIFVRAKDGVTDGIRTRNNQYHKLGLYH